MKKKIVSLLLTGVLVVGTLALAGCGSKEAAAESAAPATEEAAEAEAPATEETAEATEEAAPAETTKIVVGANITPHSEILNQAKEILAKDGIELEVVEIEDSVTPNTGVTEGTLDANYFQHQPYLDDYNAQNGTDIVSIGAIHYEPFGVYSSKLTSIADLPDDAKVAVPNNVTNEARALLLLEQEGVLKLKEDAGITATVTDIVENPKNISFVEVDPSQLVNTLADVDIAVINGNYALEGGLHIKDALAVESKDGLAAQTYGNIVAAREANANNPALLKLVEVLKSDEIKDYINNTYGGAVVPLD